jgi:hypothetical protein
MLAASDFGQPIAISADCDQEVRFFLLIEI